MLAGLSVTAFPSSTVKPADSHVDRRKELGAACAQFRTQETTADGCSTEMAPITRAADEGEEAFLERLRLRREYDKNRRLLEIMCRFEMAFDWKPNAPRDPNGPRQLPENFQKIWAPEDPSEIVREKAASEQRKLAATAGPIPQTTGKPVEEKVEEEEKEEEEKEEEEEDAQGGTDE